MPRCPLPQGKGSHRGFPPLSARKRTPLMLPQRCLLLTEAVGRACPAPGSLQSLPPDVCASSHFSQAVDLVKVKASRERGGYPAGSALWGGLPEACSPSEPGTPSPVQRPRWPQGRRLSCALCSLLQVSRARAAGGRCDDTLGSLGANAATVRHNRPIHCISILSWGCSRGADFSCPNGDFSGSGEGIRTPGSC